MKLNKIVRPDSKGRITLGKLTEGVSGYLVTKDNFNKITLEPYIEILEREFSLSKNKYVLTSIKLGIKNANQGKVRSLGKFNKGKK